MIIKMMISVKYLRYVNMMSSSTLQSFQCIILEITLIYNYSGHLQLVFNIRFTIYTL